MTKDELRKALEEGKQLDELFEFTDGQECQIFKAKCVAHFAGNHEIVYIIPEGWWEYRHFNPDDVYNNKIDCPVVGWMPMPPEEIAK